MRRAPQARLRNHPAADLFPLLDGEEFEALVEDVRANGLHEPIKLLGGLVLDGRNRLRACRAAGVEPRFEDVRTDDPTALALSLNLHRRHLTSAQRAFLALEVKRAYEVEARRRQRAGGGSVRQKVAEPLRADEAAAKACRTNRAYMQHAARLIEQAPDLAEQVRAGAADLRDAVRELRQRDAGGDPDDRYTPAEIVERVQRLFGGLADLDPACHGRHDLPRIARRCLHAKEDGLSRPWRARVYLNPPFSGAAAWMAKLAGEVEAGRVTEAVVASPLVPDRLRWDVLRPRVVVVPTERIAWVTPKGGTWTNATPSCLFYVGKRAARFREAFRGAGLVYTLG